VDLKKAPADLCQKLPAPLLLDLAAVPLLAIYRETLAHALVSGAATVVRVKRVHINDPC
jgi:hypothetical protein